MNVGQLDLNSRRLNEAGAISAAEKVEFDPDKFDETVNPDRRAKSKKSKAVAMLDREIDPRQFMKEQLRKQAKKHAGIGEGARQEVTSQIDKSIKQMFQDQAKVDIQDQVLLSQQAAPKAKLGQKKETQTGLLNATDALDEDASVMQQYGDTVVKEGAKKRQQASQQANRAQQAHQLPHSPKVLAETQLTFQKYMAAYTDALVSNTPEKKQEAAQLRQKLETLPVSLKKLKSLEARVTTMVKQDLKKELKKSFIDLALAFDKSKMTADNYVYGEKYSQLQSMAKEMGIFESAKDLKQFKNEAKRDINSFITYELDRQLTKSKLKGGDTIAEIVKAFERFNSIAHVSKFNVSNYMKKFNKKLENLGLQPFEAPEQSGIIDTDSEPDLKDGSRGHRDREEQSDDQSDNPLLLEDQLRTLYMQKVIKQGFAQSVPLNLKIFKVKQKLKQLGILSEAKLQKIQEEGKALAKFRLGDLLRESFEERATLPELRGPSFTLVRKKMKIALKGFRLLGEPLEKKQIEAIRDKINKSMFGIIREEYNKVLVHLEANSQDNILIRKEKEYKGILDRLNAESNLGEDLKQTMFKTTTFGENTSIVEAA